eukprot:XP_019930616.1 PREDICTED: eosinophil peroxidase isoform X2 [Crassostrea gigas]
MFLTEFLHVTLLFAAFGSLLFSAVEGKNKDFGPSVKDAILTGLRQLKENGLDDNETESKNTNEILTKNTKEAERLSKIGLLSIEVAKRLKEQTGLSLSEVTSDTEVQRYIRSELCPMEINCDQYKDSAYRSADGSCNSLDYPYRGAAVTPQPRYQPAQYDDGLNSPRTTGKKGDKLPSTRLISNKLFRAPGDCTETDHARTLMVMAWGQFIDHDLAFTPVTQDDSSPITCCEEGAQSRPECFPIPIPSDDPRFTHSCMELVRSASAPCQAGAREQTNEITSFIDGGVVYGDSIEKWAELVDAQTGGMLTSEGELLPAGGSCKLTNEDDFCQKAGDKRVNVVPSLGVTHLMFVREHNRIVQKLQKVRPDWDPDTLFQETRKIIGALLQQITYGEFLPSILREQDLVKYNLKLKRKRFSYSYDSSINPATKNVFNAAAFRFGHSQIPPTMAYVLHDFMTRLRPLPMESTFKDPHMLVTQQGRLVPDLARFIITSNSMKTDSQFEEAVRDHLFEESEGKGLDLGALNVQRGRDHGLPSYNAWRKWCGLPVATSFPDLQDISDNHKKILAELYSDVEDIDVYAGGIAEIPPDGASVGALFSCIIGQQFKDLKDGDRYWYENRGVEGFSSAQLQEIRKVKLAKIMCENLDVDPIQYDVFHVPSPSYSNPWETCSSLPGINFSAWRRRGRGKP